MRITIGPYGLTAVVAFTLGVTPVAFAQQSPVALLQQTAPDVRLVSSEKVTAVQPVLAQAGHKSPAAAAMLSFVLPGAGQAYNGQWKKALMHFAVAAGAVYVIQSGWTDCFDATEDYWDPFLERYRTRDVEGDCGSVIVGVSTAAVWDLFSVWDARRSAKRINSTHM